MCAAKLARKMGNFPEAAGFAKSSAEQNLKVHQYKFANSAFNLSAINHTDAGDHSLAHAMYVEANKVHRLGGL